MSTRLTDEPECTGCDSTSDIELFIDARPRDIGGFAVRRVLPSGNRRLIGPFVYLDHMGPVELLPGEGLDVPPHPHINLATVTYLFEGEIVHRDSLGYEQPIRPGAVNWMTAGRGIAHSERTGPAERAKGPRLHGIQLWVALPTAHEEAAPDFHHHPADTIPSIDRDGATIRVLAGSAFGATSPVRTFSAMFYAEADMPAGASLTLPAEHRERALYVVEGAVTCGAERAVSGRMIVFAPEARPVVTSDVKTRALLLGGEPLDGKRHIWWNFVSSRPERIEQAKRDWKEGRFPRVVGDDREFVPLPE